MTEALEQEIRTLRSLFQSDRDPAGRVFAPLADAHRRAGDLPAAIQLLNEGLPQHPDFVTGHVVAAQLYVEQGLTEEAGIAARRALELDRQNVNALSCLVRVLESQGGGPEVEDIRARLVELDPDFAAGVRGPADAAADAAADAGRDRTPEDTIGLDRVAPDPDATPETEPIELLSMELDTPPPALAETAALDSLADHDLPELAQPDSDTLHDAADLEPAALESDSGGEALTADAEPAVVAGMIDVEPSLPGLAAGFAEPEVEEDAGGTAPPTAEVVDLDSLAPEPASEEAVSLDDLAPDTEQVAGGVVELDVLAPDPVADAEPPIDLATLAPEQAPQEVVDLYTLAPEPAPEQVVDLDTLAPDQLVAEDAVELDALAPDVAADPEPVIELDALAPDVPADSEPVIELDALAPDVPADPEPVIELDALAPDAAVDPEPVIELDALAPEGTPEPTTDEVVDLDALAPDEVGGGAVELDALAPDAEPAYAEPVIDLDSLAREPTTEATVDLEALAPDADAVGTDAAEFDALVADAEAAYTEPVIDLDSLAPEPATEEAVDLDALASDRELETGDGIDLDALASEPAEQDAVLPSALAPDEPEGVVIDMDALGPGATLGPAGDAGGPMTDDDDPGEPVYTRTLGELYVTQGAVDKALEVFQHLLAEDPSNSEIAARIGELAGGAVPGDVEGEETETLARDLAESGHGEHEVDTPFAWADRESAEDGPSGPSIRDYLEGLLSWEPRERP